MPYATRNDVFDLALGAEAFVARARPFDAIDVATGIIRHKAHGFSSDDVVTLEVTSGGSLPTGLAAFTAYPVDPIAFDLLRLKNPSTGVAITSYVSGGAGWAIALDMLRRLDRHLEAAAARIDEHLTAHEPPLATPYPVQVVEINARMAARRMVTSLQFSNAAFQVAVDRLDATLEQDEEQLRRWLAGKPINPRPTDQTPTDPDNGARARAGRAALNWSTGRMF